MTGFFLIAILLNFIYIKSSNPHKTLYPRQDIDLAWGRELGLKFGNSNSSL